MTPLHHATYLGYVEIVKMLIEHPDIDLVNNYTLNKQNLHEVIFLFKTIIDMQKL